MRRIVIASLSTALALGAWVPTATADADQQAPKPIRITKVSYDPPGPDTGSNAHLNRERVTIKNFGQRTRQLRGWTLRDTAGHVFRFPRLRLRPDTTVTVHTGDGRRTRHDLYWGMGNYVWNNTGDRATLRNRDGRIIDRCRWGDGDGLKNC
jgi:Lamin Tail Domain